MKDEEAYFRNCLLADFGKGFASELAIYAVQDLEPRVNALFNLSLTASDPAVSWRAAWVLATLSSTFPNLSERQCGRLITAIVSEQITPQTCRQFLNILLCHPMFTPIRVPFYNWCIEHAFLPDEKPAMQALCLKHAWRMCSVEPDLCPELEMLLDELEPSYYSAALLSVARKVRKQIKENKRKSRR